eukprot:tig00001177_g7364.t1
MAAAHPGRVRVWYTVDRAPEGGKPWPYSTGFIDHAMLAAHMPAAGDDALVFMCGPAPMINLACIPNLDKLGFKADQRFAF